jgi:DNA polymerase-3 subunit gamma/tau
MSNLALYRKYRPDSFGSVLGQEHVVDVLRGAIELDRIAHAYLFSGPRGTGKTTIARILASEVGCKEMDLYEIDAASNRGIDEIRALRDEVRTLPFESKMKVYIIDEVHMLTKEAFNALLKTLEEPPAHAMFILATTDAHKVPETIVSRCQTFVFKKPTQEILRKMIASVTKKEGYIIDKESTNLIALLGDGSYRDTLGMIQKVLSLSADKKISIDEVERVTGAPKAKLVYGYVEALATKKTDGAIAALEDAVEANIDMKIFARFVMRVVRIVMLNSVAPAVAKKMSGDLSDDEQNEILKLKDLATVQTYAGILRELLTAYGDIDLASIPSLPLELAAVKLGG